MNINRLPSVALALTLTATLAACSSTGRRSDKVVSLEKLQIVDTHIHLYDTSRPGGVPWPPKSDSVLYSPVLTPDFDAICEAHDIEATVVVEASDLVEDNQWLLNLVAHDEKRYQAVVGNLPIGTPEFAGHLERFSFDPRFVGIRMRQKPQRNFFTDQVWSDLGLLAEKGQTLDVLMANFDLDDVAMIAERLPDLKILVNHLTGLTITGDPADPKRAEKVQKVAAFPNVYCKVSGIFQRSGQSPAPKEGAYYAPIFDTVFDAFGEDRVIYGSNWPVTARGGSYLEQLEIIYNHFAPKGGIVLRKLFAENAIQFYGLKD